MDDGLTEDDSMVPINTPTPSQENELVQKMDQSISNFYSMCDSNKYILSYVFNVFQCNYDSEDSFTNIVLDIVHQL